MHLMKYFFHSSLQSCVIVAVLFNSLATIYNTGHHVALKAEGVDLLVR